MEKKKYIIIEEKMAITLSNRINELMNDGYMPFGNPFITSIGNGFQPPSFCQAMLLKKLDDEKT